MTLCLCIPVCIWDALYVTTGFVYGYMHVLGWWSGLVIVISSQAYSQANIVIHSKQQESKYVIKDRHIQALITRCTNVFFSCLPFSVYQYVSVCS